MLIRLALAFVLAATGAGVSGLVADQPSQRPAAGQASVTVPTGPLVLPRSGEEEPAGEASDAAAGAGTDGVTVQEIDVVVPPVAPTGDVVDSPATLEAQAAPD